MSRGGHVHLIDSFSCQLNLKTRGYYREMVVTWMWIITMDLKQRQYYGHWKYNIMRYDHNSWTYIVECKLISAWKYNIMV